MIKTIRLSMILILAACLLFAFSASADESNQKTVVPKPAIAFEKKMGVEGIILDLYLAADIETIWNILLNTDNTPKLFENLVLNPVKNHPNRREYVLTHPFGQKITLCELEKNDAKHIIKWSKIRGDFKTFYGSWQLRNDKKYDGYVHLRYISFADPGGIGRMFMTKKRRKTKVLEMAERLTKLVEIAMKSKPQQAAKVSQGVNNKEKNSGDGSRVVNDKETPEPKQADEIHQNNTDKKKNTDIEGTK